MAITKPLPVPETEITSVDFVGWPGGLNLNGAQNAPASTFIESKDVELSIDGYLEPRRTLTPFLPDTVEVTYQKLPVTWNGNLYYFTADDDKIKFCQEGDTGWTDCGGTNSCVTQNGGKPKFLRVLDSVLVLNGKNGDKLAYVDLTTTGFPIVKYSLVTDPPSPMTGVLTGLTAGAYSVYYAYSYSGAVGETLLSPILTKSINVVRDQWQTLGTPGSVKVSRPAGAAPAGAMFWNLYVAIAATAGTIQASDMLRVAVKLDLANFDFVDDGSLSINLSSVAPSANSTDGPKVDNGIVEDGNPILFGDQTDPENIWIGGGGQYALDFSVSNGGYLAQPEKGTNFQVSLIIGFRNGQGIPSLTVLFSNTEGLAKQSVLEQNTVNYGSQSFTVWGVTEQHYGAAGVAAANSGINYNGKLLFLSTDGFMSMNTQPLRQNVISTDPISVNAIDSYVRGIINSAMPNVIGAGWDNKYMWTVPNAGFTEPQQLLIMDDNNKVEERSAWYTLNVPAEWVGVISPQNDAAFVYINQGKSTYKLLPPTGTFDIKGGISIPFSTGARGPLLGMYGSASHNVWQATVQAKFYVMDLIGDIIVGVTYRNQNGVLKTKTKLHHGPVYIPNSGGGWGDTHYAYANFPLLATWADGPPILDSSTAVVSKDVMISIQIDDIINEGQWFYSTPVGYSKYKLKAVSFEGINLGVRPGVQ